MQKFIDTAVLAATAATFGIFLGFTLTTGAPVWLSLVSLFCSVCTIVVLVQRIAYALMKKPLDN